MSFHSDDLYKLVAKGGGLAASAPHIHGPEVQPRMPPSEDEMARWLHPIIKQGQACAGLAKDGRVVPAKESTKLDKKLPTTENILSRVSTAHVLQFLKHLFKVHHTK
jgi:hypothetical protein